MSFPAPRETKTVVGTASVTIPGATDRRILIHKISCTGGTGDLTVSDGGATLWDVAVQNEIFHAPLRQQTAGDDITVAATSAKLSVQYSYES